MPKVTWIHTPAPKINHLAELFRAYRKATGLTSEKLAEKIGCTPENVRAQMNKPVEQWQIGRLFEYCDALGIPHEDALRAVTAE